MRGKATVLLAVALGGCGSGPTKQQSAAYARANQHFTPPATLSRAEVGGVIERRFHALDLNDDQKISADEIAAANAPWVAALDRDHDGYVSVQEFSDTILQRFDRYDLNHDGAVTWIEYQSVKHPDAPQPVHHQPRAKR